MTYIIYGVSYVLSHVSSRVSGLLGRARDERGQDLIEYVLLASLIAGAMIAAAALAGFTDAIDGMAEAIGDCIDFDDITPCDTL